MLTPQDITNLLICIDTQIKREGLNSAESLSTLARKVESLLPKEEKKIPTEQHGVENQEELDKKPKK